MRRLTRYFGATLPSARYFAVEISLSSSTDEWHSRYASSLFDSSMYRSVLVSSTHGNAINKIVRADNESTVYDFIEALEEDIRSNILTWSIEEIEVCSSTDTTDLAVRYQYLSR